MARIKFNKRLAGISIVLLSVVFLLFETNITGNVVMDSSGGINLAFIVSISFFFIGLFLLSSGNLESKVDSVEFLKEDSEGENYSDNRSEEANYSSNSSEKEKPSRWKRLKNNVASRVVAAGIVGGAGAYGGHKAGEYIQPLARPIERGYQVTQFAGNELYGMIPGTEAYSTKVRDLYLSQSGDQGREYIKNINEKNLGDRLENSIRIMQESFGRKSDELTKKTKVTREAQSLKNQVYSAVGKAVGAKDIGMRSTDQYNQNYEEIAKQRVNALLRLMQVDGEIKDYSAKMLSKGIEPGNERHSSDLESLSGEANQIYHYLESDRNLTAKDIFKRSSNYERIISEGDKIQDAGYPISENLPYYLVALGGLMGALAGLGYKSLGRGARYIGRIRGLKKPNELEEES